MGLIIIILVAVAVIGYFIWQGAKFDDSKLFNPVDNSAAKCGCGRSQTGYCVGLHKLSEEEWAVHEDNPNKTKPKRTRTKKVKE